MNEKKLTRTQIQGILDNTPSNIKTEDVLNGLVGRGYVLEGYNEPKPSFTEKVGSSLAERGQTVMEAAQKAGEATGLEKAARIGQFPLRVAGQATGALADIVGAGVSSVTPQAVKETLTPIAQQVAESKPVQQTMQAYAQIPEPVRQSISDILNVATTGFGGVGAKIAGKEAATIGEAALKSVSPMGAIKGTQKLAGEAVNLGETAVSKLASKGVDLLSKGVPETEVVDTMNTVASRIDKYTQDFVKANKMARDAESRLGESVGTYLVRRGIIPSANEAGKFDITTIVNPLSQENKVLQNAVSQKLAQSTNETNLVQLTQKLLKDVETNPRISVADIGEAKSYIEKFMSNAITRYGNKVNDEQLYKLKIDADNGYNYNSLTGDINGAKFIADDIRSSLKADQELADLLNAESKNYEVIKLAEKSLDNKTIGGGKLTTRLAQLGLSTITAGGSDTAFGKIMSALTGVVAGDKAVEVLRNLSFAGPVERKIIQNYLSDKLIKKIETGAKLTASEQSVVDASIPKLKDITKTEIVDIQKKNLNRVISDDVYQKAKENFSKKMGSINAGVRVDAIPDLAVIAGYHIENGVRSAAELAVKLADEGYKFTKAQIEKIYQQGLDHVNTKKLSEEAKKYKTAEEFVKAQENNYRGAHEAPSKQDEFSAPAYALDKIYPEDIYSSKAAQYYSSGEPYDNETIYMLQSLRGKPNAKIKIYRAVPNNKTIAEVISDYEKQKKSILRTGKIPDKEIAQKYNLKNSSEYYDFLDSEIERLKGASDVKVEKYSINDGDWVTPNRKYAVEHGMSNLNGNYKILSKTVYADEIYTDANSIQEFGYSPRKSNTKTKQLTDIWKEANKSSQENTLLSEAKKYKTVDEFIKAQGDEILHGTDKKFNTFDITKRGINENDFPAKNAFFFTNSLDTAKSYGKNIVKNYGKFEKPLTIDAEGATYGDFRDELRNVIEKAQKEGNDVVIIKNLSDRKDWGNYEPATHYAVLDVNKLLSKQQLTDIWNKANK